LLEPRVIMYPRILPTWVSQVSVSVEENDGAASTIPLPPARIFTSSERQRHYRVGRYCALLALEQIGVPKFVPGANENGGPLWPPGTVGSITHAMGFASAAVALRSRCQGIGLDLEPIRSLEKAEVLAEKVATDTEVAGIMDSAKTDFASAVTLIIAAKHSLYKCLQPQLGGRSFSYLDALIDEAPLGSGLFRARLKTTLSPSWERGTMVTGRVESAVDYVYAGIALPR
jgi:enterobactin synthetase component D